MKTKSKKAEVVKDDATTVPIEMTFRDAGPNSLFMAEHLADFGPVEIGGKKFTGDVTMALGSNSMVVDLQDKTTYPDGPLKSRRVVVSLRAVIGAVIQYVEKYPVPQKVELVKNTRGQTVKIGRTF